MRIWCKLFEKNHMLKDTVMENYDMSMSRTAKVYDCLERACYEFDLEKPMWLDKNKREFISHARTRFYQDIDSPQSRSAGYIPHRRSE